MRWICYAVLAVCAASAGAQQAIQLPGPPATNGQTGERFRFVSDGPIGPGWTRPDEIARRYFHDDLPALFERTLTLDKNVPERTTLRWIFTGPHAGFTVELTTSKVRISERSYDSTGLSEGQGNYPEKQLLEQVRQYVGNARRLTVVADGHLAVRVLVNGQLLLEAPLLFDVTRHQLMYVAQRTRHDELAGALLPPESRAATVTMRLEEIHQTMLGFGGSPSIPAYAELSEAGKQEYWRLLKRYNLLLSREYPMGTELKPDLSNLEDLSAATPHYYGDNFPNGEVSSFAYSKHVIDLGGSVIYEMWALPAWATESYSGPRVLDAWNKPIKQAARPEEYARIVVEYCKKAHAQTGVAPLIVGIQNEVEQPPAVFRAMVLSLRSALDKAGFASTRIHMADASYLFYGVDRAKDLRTDAATWKAIDYTAAHEYDFQEFLANPDLYDGRMREMHQASAGKEFLATEICLNDPHYQEPSFRIALAVAQLYHKNLTEMDAVGLLYCWLLLDVEQPTFGGSRSLLVPDRTRGWIPVPSSFELRVLGAYSRHILKGMKRIGATTGDPDLLTTAFADAKNRTLVMINRSAVARRVTIQGADQPWVEMERIGLEEDNAVSMATAGEEVLIQPGEIVVLSTAKAEDPGMVDR
jgi:O-glycosyl hydrolase